VGTAPKLAIVIVSWNTCQLLSDCLESIYNTVRRYPFDVIVVDNASSDGSAEHVRREYPQVRLMETGANLGFARGNNVALSQIHSDYVLLLNPTPSRTKAPLIDYATCSNCCRRLAPSAHKLLNPDGTPQQLVGAVPHRGARGPAAPKPVQLRSQILPGLNRR